jgi:serine/threonine protein kinase
MKRARHREGVLCNRTFFPSGIREAEACVPRNGDEKAQGHAHGRSGGYALGKYRIVAELSRGGMGLVYLAFMQGPGAFTKLLVLKELRPELLDDPAVVAMFMEEARLAGRLSHPNVVQTIEAGSDGDRPYIAMEYLDGQSFDRIISRARRKGTTAPFEMQAAVMCSALEGLAYAHAARDYDGKPLNIVHRDVSPHNIFIGYDGHVKVVDFGIAKARGSLVNTRSGLLKGRIAYMAPEQAAGLEVDARADLFSVGVALWEALTGRRFWSGMDSEMRALRALLAGEADATHTEALANIEEDLRAVIVKATAFDPSQRYQSAGQLLEELRAALAKRPARAFAPKQIGEFVQGLFAEERARLQAAISDALKRHGAIAAGSDTPASNLPILWEAVSTASSPPLSAATSGVEAAGDTTAASRWFMGSWLLAASVVVAFGVLAMVGVIAMRRAPASASNAPNGAPLLLSPSSTTSGGAAAPDPPTPDNIHVIVRATPPGAHITIDRDLLFENPCVALLPKDNATHVVRIEADGYLARDERFEASGDVTLVVALEARKFPGRAAPVTRSPVVSASPPPPAPAGAAPEPASPSTAAAQSAFVPQRRINPANPYGH